MNWWETTNCHPSSLFEWWKGWPGLCPKKKYERARGSLFAAVVWTIWESRNDKPFKNGEANLSHAEDMVRFRVAWWFKYLGKGSMDPISSILWNIKEGCSDPCSSKQKRVVVWVPPPIGSFKFNVDGSTRDPPGQAGIGGVLGDHRGKVMCVFSGNVGCQDAVTSKILALVRACKLYMKNQDMSDKNIVFVCDSTAVVNWVNGQGIGSLCHVQAIYNIRSFLRNRGQASVVYCSRASNSFADILAKQGLLVAERFFFGAITDALFLF